MYLYKKHSCGSGFRGKIIVSHGLKFCQLCGFEMRK